MSREILGALQNAAEANPEQAKQLIQQLKAKWESMSAEDRQAALEKLKELQGKMANLSDDERSEIASAINSLGQQ